MKQVRVTRNLSQLGGTQRNPKTSTPIIKPLKKIAGVSHCSIMTTWACSRSHLHSAPIYTPTHKLQRSINVCLPCMHITTRCLFYRKQKLIIIISIIEKLQYLLESCLDLGVEISKMLLDFFSDGRLLCYGQLKVTLVQPHDVIWRHAVRDGERRTPRSGGSGVREG